MDSQTSCPSNMVNTNEFAINRVLLLHDPAKATLGNLIKFLHNDDVRKSDLLSHNIPEENENKHIQKGFIFVSILVRIFLFYTKPLFKKIGFKLESFLNKNIRDTESDGFISVLGHLDTRKELDKEIKHGDGRYLPALSMMASKLVYENKSVVDKVVSHYWPKMKMEEFYSDLYNEFQEKWTTQACIFREENEDSDTVIVAFRGTSPFDGDDWSTDFDLSWCKIKKMGKVHVGFMKALGLKKYNQQQHNDVLNGDYNLYGAWPKQIDPNPNFPLAYYTIREKLKEIIANTNKRVKFIITGHSLGGALAVLFPAILALHGERELLNKLEAIYTYGQPRVGDEKFGEFMKRNLREHHIKYYRIVYAYDIVPKLPWNNTLMTFKHFGTCIHFDSLYRGKIVDEEKSAVGNNEKIGYLKTWFLVLRDILVAIIGFIPEPLNAMWELIRGLIIKFTAGPYYKEGWFLILARVFGILLPCLVDHNPQDYLNVVQLASEDLFLNYNALTYK